MRWMRLLWQRCRRWRRPRRSTCGCPPCNNPPPSSGSILKCSSQKKCEKWEQNNFMPGRIGQHRGRRDHRQGKPCSRYSWSNCYRLHRLHCKGMHQHLQCQSCTSSGQLWQGFPGKNIFINSGDARTRGQIHWQLLQHREPSSPSWQWWWLGLGLQ